MVWCVRVDSVRSTPQSLRTRGEGAQDGRSGNHVGAPTPALRWSYVLSMRLTIPTRALVTAEDVRKVRVDKNDDKCRVVIRVERIYEKVAVKQTSGKSRRRSPAASPGPQFIQLQELTYPSYLPLRSSGRSRLYDHHDVAGSHYPPHHLLARPPADRPTRTAATADLIHHRAPVKRLPRTRRSI